MAASGSRDMATFDNNPAIIDTKINGLTVQTVDDLIPFIQKNQIKIAMLTIPAVSVKELIDDIIEADIKGIWNFSYLDMEVPADVALVNVHLSDSLMTLAYKLNEIEYLKKNQ